MIAFLLAGVSIKCFSHYLKKISDPESHVFSWEFSTSSFLAYFYIAISIVNVFISNSADTFVIVVSTLNTIMLCIYAYLGIKFARHYLSKKIGLVPATIILVFAVLLFSSFSLTLLSYFGVYFTILMNRMLNTNNNFDK